MDARGTRACRVVSFEGNRNSALDPEEMGSTVLHDVVRYEGRLMKEADGSYIPKSSVLALSIVPNIPSPVSEHCSESLCWLRVSVCVVKYNSLGQRRRRRLSTLVGATEGAL